MGMEDFWEQLPTGKEDKPLLFEMGPLEYDFHDIDGLYFMLDRRLSGCLLMMWAKPMNPDIHKTFHVKLIFPTVLCHKSTKRNSKHPHIPHNFHILVDTAGYHPAI